MTSVGGVGAGQPAAVKSEQTSKTAMDYQAFLRLFTEQLKNQDPTAPMDATDSLAQLATFSQVEQSVMTNKKLDALLSSQSLSQASGAIGRNVTSADGLTSGKIVSVQITDSGLVATLDGGKKVNLGQGVTLS